MTDACLEVLEMKAVKGSSMDTKLTALDRCWARRLWTMNSIYPNDGAARKVWSNIAKEGRLRLLHLAHELPDVPR